MPSAKFSNHGPVKLTLKLRFVVLHDHANIPKWILKDDSITESVASLWSSVFVSDKLSKVFVALFQLKLLLLSKAKDKKTLLSLGWQCNKRISFHSMLARKIYQLN